MRIALNPADAAFDAAAGTITFSGTLPASLSHVLRVTNLSRGVTYFDPTGRSGDGYLDTATYVSPVLTLQGIDTRGHENSDRLFIELDDGASGGTASHGAGGAGGGLAIPAADFAKLTYTGDNLSTVTYKTGGASGTTVAIQTLTYANGEVDTISLTITKP